MEKSKFVIAEINAWVWLSDLEKKYHKTISFDTIPENEWDYLDSMGFNAIWMMGVWCRSPYGKKVSQENVDLYEAYGRSLPDWQMDDLPGSPYCVKDYSVDPRFGGNSALKKLRKKLKSRKIKLFLDFVPNHSAIDHSWIDSHPDFLIPGDEVDLIRSPRDFFHTSNGVFANGRDPFFPSWQDVAQLNAFSTGYRKAAAEELKKIGELCDGVRCDMAMLMLNRVFSYTWQNRGGAPLQSEFWTDVISDVRTSCPEMIFIAEVYWGLEWDLMQIGFDYCYDKRLYDRLIHESADTVKQHLQADFGFQSHLLRFLENHDEDRAAANLPLARLKAASVIMAAIPGACLINEGQWEGRKIWHHVLLGRRQPEPLNEELHSFYQTLFSIVTRIPSDGLWYLCPVSVWSDNKSGENIIAFGWDAGNEKFVVIVNFSDRNSQGRVRLPWRNLIKSTMIFTDLFNNETIIRNVDEISVEGLFVNLPPWGFHYFSTTV
jgi:glycosidase